MRGGSRGRVALLAVLVLGAFFLGTGGIKPANAIVEGLERARLQRLTTDYTVKETENFIIRFYAGDAGLSLRWKRFQRHNSCNIPAAL